MSYGCLPVTRWNPFIGISLHDAMVLNPVTGYLPADYWPYVQFGLVSGTHLFSYWSEKKDREILLDGVHFIGRTSDAFPVVPHVDMVQGWNPLVIFNTLFGSSISVWGTSGVTIATKNPLFGATDCDLACTPFAEICYSLHLSCFSPVSLPVDFTVVWGTAKAGFTWADFLACLVDVAIEIATDIVMKFGGAFLKKVFTGAGKGVKKLASLAAKKAVKEVAEEVVEVAVKKVAKEVAEEAVEKVGKEVAEEAVEKIGKEVVEEAAEEAGEKAAKEVAEEVGDKAGKEVAEAAAEEAGKEASSAAAEKAAKEVSEEAAEEAASKSGKSAAESFSETLDAFRKEADDELDEVVEEMNQPSKYKAVAVGAEEAAEETDSLLTKAWAKTKSTAKATWKGAKNTASRIKELKTWKKVTETKLLARGDFLGVLGYIGLAKGFKYSKKIYKNVSLIAQSGKVGDQDADSSSYNLFLWNLGSRDGVLNDVGGETPEVTGSGTSSSDRFEWAEDLGSGAGAEDTTRFAWMSEYELSTTATVTTTTTDDDRFSWVDESEAEGSTAA